METDAWEAGRTVVVSGVPDVLPVGRMVDKLTVHFQSYRRSRGGDVEVVTYPTNVDGVAFVAFDKAEDAERVVQKDKQTMTDNEFPEDYLLTVFPFTREVFFYVPSATVDLSVFGSDQALLIHSLRSAHRALRFRPLLKQRKATVEGPFSAVQAMRADLISRAGQPKSTVSAQTAAVKGRETPLNPKVISHHELVASVSCSGAKAKLETANSLSTPLQTTGEATESLLSNANTQNTPCLQKVSFRGLAVGSFCDTDSDEVEQQRARARLQMPTEFRTEPAKADPRLVFGEEINAGIRSSLSGLDHLPSEEISAKQPQEDDISQKHTRPDRVSASKIRGENHMGSRYSNTDYLKDSDQSSSAVTTKLLQSRLKDVWQSSESDTKGAEDLSEISPKDLEDKSIWVDSYAFRYIEKFYMEEFNRGLRGVNTSVECVEGTDLMRIVLTEKPTSKTASRIQQALENLNTLVGLWMSVLRVHQIYYDEEEQPEKQKLIHICDDVNLLFDDVLCVFEDSCVKIIGPSVSSHRLYKRVKDRMTQRQSPENVRAGAK